MNQLSKIDTYLLNPNCVIWHPHPQMETRRRVLLALRELEVRELATVWVDQDEEGEDPPFYVITLTEAAYRVRRWRR